LGYAYDPIFSSHIQNFLGIIAIITKTARTPPRPSRKSALREGDSEARELGRAAARDAGDRIWPYRRGRGASGAGAIRPALKSARMQLYEPNGLTMAAKLFLCYRRDDSAHFAGRVQDRLGSEFGRDLLFMDVDTIPLGVNFSKVLREEVAKCRVLLAMIGPNWLDAVDKDGNRRLDDPNDFVRIEIAAALQRDIPVIPILLDGARVPKADELPKDLGELSMRNGLDVRHASFHNDIDRLVRNLKGQLGEADSEERRRDGDERRPARPAEDTAEWQRLQEEEKNQLQELEKTKENRGRAERWLLPLIGAGAAFVPTFLITPSEPSIALTTGMLSILYGGIAGMLVRNRVDILKAVAIPIIPAFLLLYSLNPAHIPSDVDTLRFAAMILGSGASCVWLALWLYSTWPRKQQKGSMRAL